MGKRQARTKKRTHHSTLTRNVSKSSGKKPVARTTKKVNSGVKRTKRVLAGAGIVPGWIKRKWQAYEDKKHILLISRIVEELNLNKNKQLCWFYLNTNETLFTKLQNLNNLYKTIVDGTDLNNVLFIEAVNNIRKLNNYYNLYKILNIGIITLNNQNQKIYNLTYNANNVDNKYTTVELTDKIDISGINIFIYPTYLFSFDNFIELNVNTIQKGNDYNYIIKKYQDFDENNLDNYKPPEGFNIGTENTFNNFKQAKTDINEMLAKFIEQYPEQKTNRIYYIYMKNGRKYVCAGSTGKTAWPDNANKNISYPICFIMLDKSQELHNLPNHKTFHTEL